MTSPERLPVAPDVPTLKEQGIPIVSYGWWGVCAPSGVPKTALDILNRRIAEAVASSDFKAAIEKTGVAAVSSTVEEAAREYAATSRDAAKTFRELGIAQID
jgi:tripartite-type tricarboxylate transporter receptor subunit TctC